MSGALEALRAEVLAGAPAAPEPPRAGGRVVPRSEDFERVDALPRRRCEPVDGAFVTALTERWRAHGGTMRLRPIQAAALWEAHTRGGLFAPIGVGQGKTLIDALLPLVLDSERAVILTAPALVAQLERDLRALAAHWCVRLHVITVVSYGALSTAAGTGLLERLAPDLIVADECHYLRHGTAARTKRFLRYMAAHPRTRFCAMSGTITARSLRDYAHLARLALGAGAPVPLHRSALDAWCGALDEGLDPAERCGPGVLARWAGPGETVRAGFRRRLVETPGVVATTESAVETGLELHARGLKCPRIAAALERLALTAADPQGVALPDKLAVARVARQLACGFWYRWAWPGGEPDHAWLAARNAWHGAVYALLAEDPGEGLDSPLLLARAAERGELTPRLQRLWSEWDRVRARPEPPVEAVWFSDALVRDVARAVRAAGEPVLVWYEHAAVGERLAAHLGVPLYGPGAEPPAAPAHTCVVSARAHGTGRNLQGWARNLVVTAPSSGAAWEQLIGRTHRPGQGADVVVFEVYAHAEALARAVAQARRDAGYIEATTGQVQKLGLATWVGWSAEGKGDDEGTGG